MRGAYAQHRRILLGRNDGTYATRAKEKNNGKARKRHGMLCHGCHAASPHASCHLFCMTNAARYCLRCISRVRLWHHASFPCWHLPAPSGRWRALQLLWPTACKLKKRRKKAWREYQSAIAALFMALLRKRPQRENRRSSRQHTRAFLARAAGSGKGCAKPTTALPTMPTNASYLLPAEEKGVTRHNAGEAEKGHIRRKKRAEGRRKAWKGINLHTHHYPALPATLLPAYHHAPYQRHWHYYTARLRCLSTLPTTSEFCPKPYPLHFQRLPAPFCITTTAAYGPRQQHGDVALPYR